MGEVAPIESVADRLRRVLDGRSPWKWGARVGLSDGTIGRMMKGSLPDPEKLIPAMRIENLSMNWLLDGMGAPHPMWAPISDAEAAKYIDQHLHEDIDAEVLIVHSKEGFTPVMHSMAHVESKSFQYDYRAVTLLGGGVFGRETLQKLNQCASKSRRDGRCRVRSVYMPEIGWRLLSHGQIGNYHLFGDETQGDQSHDGIYQKSRPEVSPAELQNYVVQGKHSLGQVTEPNSTWLSSAQREVNQLYEMLPEADQLAALRMLRGLRYPTE